MIEWTMERERVSYLMLDIDFSGSAKLEVFPQDSLLQYPRAPQLKHDLASLRSHYVVENSGEILMALTKEREFSNDVKELFLNETTALTRGVDTVIRKERSGIFDNFSKQFMHYYIVTYGQTASRADIEFMRALSGSQSFAYIYDELFKELQGNYARVLTIKRRDSRAPCTRVTVRLAPQKTNVLAILNQLVEVALNRKGRDKSQQPMIDSTDREIALKEKFDWAREIQRMKRLDAKRQILWRLPSGRPSSAYRASGSKQSTSSDSSGPPILNGVAGRDPAGSEEIVMTVFENTNRATAGGRTQRELPRIAVRTPLFARDPNKFVKKRKGPLFYGPTGFHAFLTEMLASDEKSVLEQLLIESVKDCLERLNNTLGIEQLIQVEEEEGSGRGSILTEGTFLGGPRLNELPSATDSLVDPPADDLVRGPDSARPEAELLSFSLPNSCQFHLYCAFYLSRYKQHAYEIVKVRFRNTR